MTEIYHRRSDCRLCGKTKLTLVFKLEPTPPANAFVKKDDLGKNQTCFPLDVFFCESCYHLQLLDVIDPKILFENYVFVSGTSPVTVKHFEDYAKNILRHYPQSKNSLIIDIGSNDGTLLRFFKKEGFRVLGIDPAKEIADKATNEGIETLPIFFNFELSQSIREKYGPASVITANNIFAHVDNLKDFVKGIRNILSPNGIFVFEVSYLVDVIKKILFDMTYHEHLAYHSVRPLISFFETNGLQLIDSSRIDVHGGSLRGIVQLKDGPHAVKNSVYNCLKLEKNMKLHSAQTYKKFGYKIKVCKDEIRSLLRQLKSQGKTIAGYGAPAKTTTLMYHFGIGPEIIDFIVDDNPLKQGLFSPGMHIPVLPAKKIYDKKPNYLIIFAWNFADSIMKKHNEFRINGSHFIVPLPNLKVY